jgi:hypothetical protein
MILWIKKKCINFLVTKVKTNLFKNISIFENMQCVNDESNVLFDQTIQFDTHYDELITTNYKTYYKFYIFIHEVRKWMITSQCVQNLQNLHILGINKLQLFFKNVVKINFKFIML